MQAAALELQCEGASRAPSVLAALLLLPQARADWAFASMPGRVLLLHGAFVLKIVSSFQWHPFCLLLCLLAFGKVQM